MTALSSETGFRSWKRRSHGSHRWQMNQETLFFTSCRTLRNSSNINKVISSKIREKKAKSTALPPTKALSLSALCPSVSRLRVGAGVGAKDICHVICVVQETTCVLMCEWVEKRMSLSISSDQRRSRSRSESKRRRKWRIGTKCDFFFALKLGLCFNCAFAFCWCHKFALRQYTHFCGRLLRSLDVGSDLRYRFTN